MARKYASYPDHMPHALVTNGDVIRWARLA
jgi:hypothetical protein